MLKTASQPKVQGPCKATNGIKIPLRLFGPAMASAMLLASPMSVDARPPPRENAETRCTLEALDKFADTRAKFSMEASSGGMEEAVVDVRGCSFKGMDLRNKVLSGVIMQGADFSGTNLSGVQMSRADARGANFADANMDDLNGYGTLFDGANCENVTFSNAILSSSSFGKFENNWANMKNTHFEGALLSSSDVIRVCENPTLLEDTRRYELGCRGSR
uniref:Pentapeptide repeat-containing protein n=1 Tax=Dunaliella tertiolecta TaxID=3047 RepID=A0A7S3QW89_DUNTE|mmetsp:Transcript_10348/g.26966  ORF Transcript_10348/g.26966 Transcript_10348/m.26966 type:complete len:218 (-) Transcript_10348:414-1067(-)